MQRLRPEADEQPQDIRKSTGRGTVSAQSRVAPAPAETQPAKPVDVTPLTSLSELAPRSQAPEMGANLAAMRELANSAARGAIELHQQQSGKKRLTTRSIKILFATLATAGLTFWWWLSGSWFALGGASLCLIWVVGDNLLAGWRRMAVRKPISNAGAAPPKP
jgi:hypothetical protein